MTLQRSKSEDITATMIVAVFFYAYIYDIPLHQRKKINYEKK